MLYNQHQNYFKKSTSLKFILSFLCLPFCARSGEIPVGTVAGFMLKNCPEGWKNASDLSGRFIISTGPLRNDHDGLSNIDEPTHTLTVNPIPVHQDINKHSNDTHHNHSLNYYLIFCQKIFLDNESIGIGFKYPKYSLDVNGSVGINQNIYIEDTIYVNTIKANHLCPMNGSENQCITIANLDNKINQNLLGIHEMWLFIALCVSPSAIFCCFGVIPVAWIVRQLNKQLNDINQRREEEHPKRFLAKNSHQQPYVNSNKTEPFLSSQERYQSDHSNHETNISYSERNSHPLPYAPEPQKTIISQDVLSLPKISVHDYDFHYDKVPEITHEINKSVMVNLPKMDISQPPNRLLNDNDDVTCNNHTILHQMNKSIIISKTHKDKSVKMTPSPPNIKISKSQHSLFNENDLKNRLNLSEGSDKESHNAETSLSNQSEPVNHNTLPPPNQNSNLVL